MTARIEGFSTFTDILGNRYAICLQCPVAANHSEVSARTLRTLRKRAASHLKEFHS